MVAADSNVLADAGSLKPKDKTEISAANDHHEVPAASDGEHVKGEL